jgi:DNA-directed RNA polymerase subunit RPC12/RpoP
MRAGIKCLKCGKMISHDAYDLYSTHDGIKPPEHTISVPCPHCQSQIECAAAVRHRENLEKHDNLYRNVTPSNPADWCFGDKNLLVLVDNTFKGVVGENVTREQLGEIIKLLTGAEAGGRLP